MPQGIGEWIIILVIVLVIFGASRLPQVGEAFGKFIHKFRGALEDKEGGGSKDASSSGADDDKPGEEGNK